MSKKLCAVAVAGLFVLSFAAIASTGAIPRASAASGQDLISWCKLQSGVTFTSSTCTITSSSGVTMAAAVEIFSGETLYITTGYLIINSLVVLTVDSGGTVQIQYSGPYQGIFNSGGTIINSGTIYVENTAGTGISNEGTITNHGTMTISNGGVYGIYNIIGAIQNAGTINLQNSGGYAIDISGGKLTNSGTINVESTGGWGIYNENSIINSATITISNGGSFYDSISNIGTLTNNAGGTITISNSVSNSIGIYNEGGTITDTGTINVENTAGTGLDNSGTINIQNTAGDGIHISTASGTVYNTGTITISIGGSGSYGIYNNPGTITNTGNINVENSVTGSTGIFNDGAINNNAGGVIALSNSNFGGTGIYNYNSGTLDNYGAITASTTVDNLNIENDGSFTNELGGTITLSNSGSASQGIYDYGPFTNYGNINVENTGTSSNEGIIAGQGMTNEAGGTITISNGVGDGIYNGGNQILDNYGTINIQNTGGDGVYNPAQGTITNEVGGTITISNSVSGSVGIYNDVYTPTPIYGQVTNDGTINVDNTAGTGIVNEGTLTNNAGDLITVSCSGTITNDYTIDNQGTITDSGTITGAGTISGTQPVPGSSCNVIPTAEVPFGTILAVSVPLAALGAFLVVGRKLKSPLA